MIDSRPGTLARAGAIRMWVARGERVGRALARGVETAYARLRTVLTRIERLQRQRLAIRELERLDDRLLNDIGLRRDQIPAAAAGSVRREAEVPAGRAAQSAASERPAEDERFKSAA